jgi:riboflavin biosynthesis pyrimidine reductase
MGTEDRTTTASNLSQSLLALYPERQRTALEGLYLSEDIRRCRQGGNLLVYSNFIASLDGRIAVTDSRSGEPSVPEETANPRDWRLLLELAAPADALIISGRYVRELAAGKAQSLPPFQEGDSADLLKFRKALGLPVQPVLVVVSNSLDLPLEALFRDQPRPVLVATSEQADAEQIRQTARGQVEVVRVGRDRVEGDRLVAALGNRDLTLIYSIAGPAVLHMLLTAGVLDRLYLTTVLRVLGGKEYVTMARGERLTPPYDFCLSALYLDPHGPDGVEQLLQVFDHRP